MKVASGGLARVIGPPGRKNVRFPITVFAAWRFVEGALILGFGAPLLGSTFRWDGNWYFSILEHGYTTTGAGFTAQQNTAFFPGTVWLTEPLRVVMPDRWAAFTVANLTAAAAFVAVFMAVRSYAGDRPARMTTIALALWPASLFLWAYYSDALLVAASAIAVWSFREDRPGVTMASALAASCTRLMGVALGPVLAFARIYRNRRLDAIAVGYVASSAIGLAAVSAAQGLQAGQPLGFLRAQKAWGRGFAAPWQPFSTAVREINQSLPHLHLEISMELCAVVVVGLAVIATAFRWARSRTPLLPALWAAVAWFVPLLSRLISSQMRFALAAWPAFTIASAGRGRTVRAARIVGALAGLAVAVVLLHRWAHNQFDG